MSVKIIDNHAHSFRRDYLNCNESGFLGFLCESKEEMAYHVRQSVAARQFLLALQEFSGTADLGEYLRDRREEIVSRLFGDAAIDCLLIDGGYSEAGDSTLTAKELSSLAGVKVFSVLRLETLFEKLLRAHCNLAELEAALLTELSAPDVVALKTIRAYRGGLQSAKSGHTAFDFDAAKTMVQGGRLEHCPYYEHLFMLSLQCAAERGLPVQVHCGLGDDDALLGSSNPLLLQPLLRARSLPALKLVLLHCYPFEREAAYLASLYDGVYMDLSLTAMLVGADLKAIFRTVFALAPFSKILAGTDGHSQPESYWWAARSTRSALNKLLSEWTEDGTIAEEDKKEIEASYLRENARRLYNLDLED